jgi:hypothetical protein
MVHAFVIAVALSHLVGHVAKAVVAPQTATNLLPDCSSFIVTQVVTATSNIRGGNTSPLTTSQKQPCPTDRCAISAAGKCVARPISTTATPAIPQTTTLPSTPTTTQGTTTNLPATTIPSSPTATTTINPATNQGVTTSSTQAPINPSTSQATILSTTQGSNSATNQAAIPATVQGTIPSTTQATIPSTVQGTNQAINKATILPTNQGAIASTTQATILPTQGIVPCASRNLGKCEDGDGLCIKVLNTCQAINGEGRENQRCLAALSTNSDGDLIYVEALGMGCAAGLVCNVANNSNSNVLNMQLEGFCEPQACAGNKIPGSCIGNGNALDASCNSATKRVTICHRTCSETNPWVRITIDDSAWNGQGCGHQFQHDIRDECRNKAPWTAWGNHYTDYLLKEHGTRADVAAKFKNMAQEKAYWKKWERACPSVRNGECCDWNDPDNLCCGDAPGTAYNPKIQLKKYAGPVGKCSAAGIAELHDDTYTLPTSTSEWQYCYVVSVPTTSKECLYKVTISDPMLAVGSLRDGLMNVTAGNTDFLCPGEVKYIEGEVEKGLEKYEAPSEAKVTALGIFSLLSVYDLDFAGVDAPITLESTTEIKLGNYEKDLCLYLSVDPPECPQDVVLLTKGLTELKVNPIVLSSQDEDTVTFNITNPFGRNLRSVFYQYATAETGASKCYEEADMSACPKPIQVTAHCMAGPGHPPFAIINVWFADQTFMHIGNADPVPKCCHPEDETPAIEYTFQVFCKSQCAPDKIGSG